MSGDEPIRTGNHAITPADIDPDAFKVLRRLSQFGYHAYLVGGGVRDLLLGRAPKDFDIATSARPSEIRRLFRNCRLIGRRFRLAHICFAGGKVIEVATFRAAPDHDDDDGPIRDDNEFGTPATDAVRRDFTVNALFYDPVTDEVIDYVGGLEDLADRRIRTIGDAPLRFREDPVRILRAVKFAARLGLEPDAETRAAILTERYSLRKAAVPRLLEEIVRMLWQGAAARSYELMAELGLLELLLPEIAGFLGRPAEEPWKPLRGLLHALDRRHNGEQQHSMGVLLAVLYWPLYQAIIAELPNPDGPKLRKLAETLVAPAAVRLRIPRREIATLIAALEGQVRFEQARRRKNTRVAFARSSTFPGVLDLFELRREAEPISSEQVAALHMLARESPADTGDFAALSDFDPFEEDTEGEGEPGQRRRRRRRR
ncbi:MAG: polynucleotide adenylyltransferase PcnB [bacterium]